MRKALLLVAIATLLAACQECKSGSERKNAETPLDTIPMLIMQVQKCSRLYTSEYDIHKIVTHNDEKRLKGNLFGHNVDVKIPVGERQIAIPMDAKVKAYIDFSNFSERNIIRNGKKITIILPDPKATLTSTKIDQANIKQFVSITRSDFTDAEMTNFERQGREAILKSLPELGIADNARDNAARVLIPLIESLGYNEGDITISFRKDFAPRDLDIVIDNSTIER